MEGASLLAFTQSAVAFAIRLTFVEVKESSSGYGMKSKVDKLIDKLIGI